MMKKSSLRILVFTPVFPQKHKGAAEQDQIFGALNLRDLGHTVRLSAFLPDYQQPAEMVQYAAGLNLEATTCSYPREIAPSLSRLKTILQEPALIDGSAYQNAHPKIIEFAKQQIEIFQPDLIWVELTFLWKIAQLAKEYALPVMTRSHNYEPQHLLDESGYSLLNLIRYWGKYQGEKIALHFANTFAAITPVEQARYQKLNPARSIAVLPLRSLPQHLRPPKPIQDKPTLHVFFWGSTFNVSHNRHALQWVVQNLVPQIRKRAPNQFVFHLIGGKMPTTLTQYAAPDLHFHGYVNDLEALLAQMDIALMPSLHGCGMQQKIFEPLARGFPTLTHARGIAGYPFTHHQHILLAQTETEFVHNLLELRSRDLRAKLSTQAYQQSTALFSQTQINKITEELITGATTESS